MATNKKFDPTQYGATKFDPTQYGATPSIEQGVASSPASAINPINIGTPTSTNMGGATTGATPSPFKQPTPLSSIAGVASRALEIPSIPFSIPAAAIQSLRGDPTWMKRIFNPIELAKEVAKGATEGFWTKSNIPTPGKIAGETLGTGLGPNLVETGIDLATDPLSLMGIGKIKESKALLKAKEEAKAAKSFIPPIFKEPAPFVPPIKKYTNIPEVPPFIPPAKPNVVPTEMAKYIPAAEKIIERPQLPKTINEIAPATAESLIKHNIDPTLPLDKATESIRKRVEDYREELWAVANPQKDPISLASIISDINKKISSLESAGATKSAIKEMKLQLELISKLDGKPISDILKRKISLDDAIDFSKVEAAQMGRAAVLGEKQSAQKFVADRLRSIGNQDPDIARINASMNELLDLNVDLAKGNYASKTEYGKLLKSFPSEIKGTAQEAARVVATGEARKAEQSRVALTKLEKATEKAQVEWVRQVAKGQSEAKAAGQKVSLANEATDVNQIRKTAVAKQVYDDALRRTQEYQKSLMEAQLKTWIRNVIDQKNKPLNTRLTALPGISMGLKVAETLLGLIGKPIVPLKTMFAGSKKDFFKELPVAYPYLELLTNPLKK